MGSAAYAAGPLGYLVAGPLIESWGVQRTFLVLALVLLVVTVLAAFLPSLRGLDDAPLPGSAADPRPDPRTANPHRRLAEAEEIVAARLD
jgi:MFS family permease